MANRIIEVPVGATKIGAWMATSTGRAALEAGGELLHRVQPGYESPVEAEYRKALKELEGKVGFVSLIDEDISRGKLMDRAYMAVDAAAEEGVVNERSVVELHPVLPADSSTDPLIDQQSERARELLELAFEEEYNVQVVPSGHTITPSQREDGPLDITTTMRNLGSQAHGLLRQFHRDEYDPAMLGITRPSYERAMFSGHTVIAGNPDNPKLLVLDTVGDRLEQSKLVLH